MTKAESPKRVSASSSPGPAGHPGALQRGGRPGGRNRACGKQCSVKHFSQAKMSFVSKTHNTLLRFTIAKY